MSERGEIRGDFIRRLFAVAISVGFAATLIQMPWVQGGTWPSENEWQQLVILGTGLVATVLSWDGYLTSIKTKPLDDYPRFAIDIGLVFVYMFLLLTSKHPAFWLPVLVLIFGLYALWDLLTVIGHYKAYQLDASNDANQRPTVGQVARVYWYGLLNRPRVKRGPIVTLSWGLYFVGLLLVTRPAAKYQVYVTCGFAILGLYLYRHDKSMKPDSAAVEGYRMITRVVIVIGLLGAAALYFCAFRVGSRP